MTHGVNNKAITDFLWPFGPNHAPLFFYYFLFFHSLNSKAARDNKKFQWATLKFLYVGRSRNQLCVFQDWSFVCVNYEMLKWWIVNSQSVLFSHSQTRATFTSFLLLFWPHKFNLKSKFKTTKKNLKNIKIPFAFKFAESWKNDQKDVDSCKISGPWSAWIPFIERSRVILRHTKF